MIDIFNPGLRRSFLADVDPDGKGGDGGASGSAGSGDKGGEGDNKPKTITKTQEELDALFAERATRGGEAAIKKLLKDTGFATIEDLLANAKTGKETSDAAKTELQKAQDAAKAAEDKLKTAEEERTKALAAANERLLKAEVKTIAATEGFRPESLDDVFLVIDRSKITEKDGTFTGVKEAIQAVAKAKPFWLQDKNRPNGTPGGKNGTGKKTAEDIKAERPTMHL